MFASIARAEFERYKRLGEGTFAQLSDDELTSQSGPEALSVSTLVKHLHGNMLSRFTNFLEEDGEKEWRKREGEFENDIATREEMLRKWEEGWACVFAALDTVNAENQDATVLIRNEPHSITQALTRQLCHYAYHIGQIVYIGKEKRGTEWRSLSIPRGGTAAFNSSMFSKGDK